ncbi:myosin light chain kinase, smooth muscle-like [Penaeus japonicus]|uniref:myosin light chain kinase, smooth muscle-like n=1 Tax=Penaeus japonicus TaxID=27405 RepID=UPI001C70F985|nr:myosin light chain kinase, smooth muscle-like [Penaeus japonicus]
MAVQIIPKPVAPEVQPFWIPDEVKEGQLVQIMCTAMGDEPLTLQWYKDDIPLMSSSTFMINKLDSSISNLIMRGVTSEHSGKYTCAAFNSVGQSKFEKELRVKGKSHLKISQNCMFVTDFSYRSAHSYQYFKFCLLILP